MTYSHRKLTVSFFDLGCASRRGHPQDIVELGFLDCERQIDSFMEEGGEEEEGRKDLMSPFSCGPIKEPRRYDDGGDRSVRSCVANRKR